MTFGMVFENAPETELARWFPPGWVFNPAFRKSECVLREKSAFCLVECS